MSLKSIHIFFVFCTFLLLILVSILNFSSWLQYGGLKFVFYAIISLSCSALVIFYGIKFLGKFKKLSFM